MKIEWLHILRPYMLSLLRIVAGFLIWQRGAQKLLGWFGGEIATECSWLWSAGMIEFIGGPLILLGLLTQTVAIVLAGEMLVAYWFIHVPQGFWPLRNGGEVTMEFFIAFLLFAFFGPGKLSMDALFRICIVCEKSLNRIQPYAHNLLRILTGIMFWQHGASKFGIFGGNAREFPDLTFFAGVLEFIGGPLIALGAFVRPVTFVLSGEMAYAFWFSHVPRGPSFWPVQNGGEMAVLFCFIFLFFLTSGAGKFSVDGLLRK